MRSIVFVGLVFALGVAAQAQSGGRLELAPGSITAGGGASGGGPFTLEGTIGQHDVGTSKGGRFRVLGGLWSAVSTITTGPCIGDCQGDGQVDVDDLVTMVGLSLDDGAPQSCAAGDADENGRVSVDEVIAAVGSALRGCF